MSRWGSPRAAWARHGSYLLAGSLGIALLAGGLRRRAAPELAPRAAPTAAVLASSTLDPPSTHGESSSVAVSTWVPRTGPTPAVTAPPSAPVAPSPGEPPHPISPAHQRIFEENNRIAALDGALDRGDVAALRSLNAEYRSAYPEDEQVLQQGYDLIADCLEQRTAQVVDEARRFWREKRSSRLRRTVRKLCLEGVHPE